MKRTGRELTAGTPLTTFGIYLLIRKAGLVALLLVPGAATLLLGVAAFLFVLSTAVCASVTDWAYTHLKEQRTIPGKNRVY